MAAGAITDARANYEQAAPIAGAIDALPEKARAIGGVGQCELWEGQNAEAHTSLRRALAFYEQIESPRAKHVIDVLRGNA